VLGSVCPLSRRAMVDWLVPIRAASSAWDRPARLDQLGGNLEFRDYISILRSWRGGDELKAPSDRARFLLAVR
jgi:hypothetical protein